MADNTNRNPDQDAGANVSDSFGTLLRSIGRFFTDPNQLRLAVRTRSGATLFRLPIAIASIIGLVLLWKAFLLLAVIVIAVYASRSSFVLVRPTSHPS